MSIGIQGIGVNVRGAGLGGAGAAPAPDWWIVNTDQYVSGAGLLATTWTSSTAFSGSTGAGRTVLNNNSVGRIKQDTVLARAAVRAFNAGAALGWQIKVFRVNGATFDFVGESQLFTPARQGYTVVEFDTPFAVLQGDTLGVFVAGNATASLQAIIGASGDTGIREDGNISASGEDFVTSEAATCPQMQAHFTSPHAAFVGDSWISRHTASGYFSQSESTPFLGPRTSEVPYQMRALGYVNAAWEFQNYSILGMTMANVIALGNFAAAVATRAPAIIMMAGGNDINNTASDADDIEVLLNGLPALLLPHQHLFVSEIGPGSGYSDAEAAILRATNTRIASWCAANDATCLIMHDDLAKVRVSTGQLDDLKTSPDYDHDGLHLTQLGVDKLAELWAAGITAYYEANPTIDADPLATNSMPVPTVLYSGSDIVSTTTMVSTSIAPAANSLLLGIVGNGTATGALLPVLMSGLGLTWTSIQQMQGTGSGIYAGAAFWAKTVAAPTPGAVTATWNVVGTRKSMHIIEIPLGVDLTDPIVQSVIAAVNAVTGTVTLPGTPAANSTIIAVAHSNFDSDVDVRPAVLFAQLAELTVGSGSSSGTLQIQFYKAGTGVPPAPVTTSRWDGMGSANNVLLAFEVRAAEEAE